MPYHNRTIWDDEVIDNVGTCKEVKDSNTVCVQKKIKLEYPGLLEKVELSFKFDVSNFVGCILDDNKPIIINDQRVPLQLPSDRNKLKYVEMTGVDITKYLKSSANGELNTIQVNYRVRDRPSFFGRGKKSVGKLKLALTIHWAGADGQSSLPPTKIVQTQKYCMWHGEPVDPSALYCPFKGGERFETTLSPQTTKICPNPSCPGKKIHVREIYCEYCDVKQPGMGTPTSPSSSSSSTAKAT